MLCNGGGSMKVAERKPKPVPPTPEQIAAMVKRMKERQADIAANKRRTKKI